MLTVAMRRQGLSAEPLCISRNSDGTAPAATASAEGSCMMAGDTAGCRFRHMLSLLSSTSVEMAFTTCVTLTVFFASALRALQPQSTSCFASGAR